MQPEDKHLTRKPEKGGNDKKTKKEKPKSFLETVREIDEKERKREGELEEKRQKILEERRKKEQEAYDKKIREERIELMRMKQGLITESELIHEEKKEKTKLPLGKKIANFFYHSKWWLVITALLAGIGGYMLYDYLTLEHPDMIVMLLTDDTTLQASGSKLSDYFEGYIEDYNGDGKVLVDIYPIPVDNDISKNDYYLGNMTKLSSQFQMADSIMVISDAVADKVILPDDTLADLEELFPDNKNVRSYGFYIRNTDFMEQIGCEDTVLDRDIYVGLRKPVKTFDSVKEMRENYDIALGVLEKMIDDLPYVQKNRTFDMNTQGGIK
ncbi:MAG: hypothetical protein ACI4JD_07650 [Ruminococcus sp.]